ncbi:cytochrome c biogenesis protein CcdA [Lentisphaerota bacterium WC36G]|nr:thioredoxin family protein [Lentisphaerae bacterium WC36]
MKKLLSFFVYAVLQFLICTSYASPFADPFNWEAKLDKDKNLIISVTMPKHHYLYTTQTKVDVKNFHNESLKAQVIPKDKNHFDSITNTNAKVLMGKKLIWQYKNLSAKKFPLLISLTYQGCKDQDETGPSQCFIPNEKNFFINSDAVTTKATAEEIEKFKKAAAEKNQSSETVTASSQKDNKKQQHLNNIKKLLTKFTVAKTGSGFMNVEEMNNFLSLTNSNSIAQSAENAATEIPTNSQKNDLVEKLKSKNVFVMLLLIFLGGLALNLTPCVLPLIPVNLAVIGAGSSAKSKFSGLIRGSIYALGIMISYGILGLFAVLASTPLGSLNSSPWFNFTITFIFIILGLGMFDVFVIDLSKYGSGFGPKVGEKVGYFWTFFLGIITALLAGACVAPVLIAVLIIATDFSQQGNALGFALPFILGLGMAAPWPLTGAGLSVLPKPGVWMNKVKHTLGVIIFILAAYYAYEGYHLLPSKEDIVLQELENLEKQLQEADSKQKPVFIDFWATWCKNCLAMNAKTFKDEGINQKLESNFVEIKFQAEKPSGKFIKQVLEIFAVKGMPEYRILVPKKNSKAKQTKNKLKALFSK